MEHPVQLVLISFVYSHTCRFFVCNILGHKKCLSVSRADRATKQLKLRPYRFQAAHQLQQLDTAARIQYNHWFRRFVREWVHVE
jgi:hypothetical protein